MSKRKLLVVAGAGASIDYGMPSVSDVAAIIHQRVHKFFIMANDASMSLYAWLADALVAQANTKHRPVPNFEDALYALYFLDGLHGSLVDALVDVRAVPQILFLGQQRPTRVDNNVWHALAGYAADAIVDEFRERCRQLEATQSSRLEELRRYFSVLADEFDISVVTLNYDDILYRCLPGMETGFDRHGRFDDRLLIERRQWSCMLHLHGSVHFDMRMSRGSLHEIHWQQDLNQPFQQNASGRSSVTSAEPTTFPQSVIVAGYGKTTQILRRPFRTYYAELERLIVQSDALLCLGYGFADQHLNAALEEYRDDRRRPVVIVDWANDNQMSAASAASDIPRRSIVTALEVLATDPNSMKALGFQLDNVSELKRQRVFDRCEASNTPLAVWYNGMYEASKHPDRVLNELNVSRPSNATGCWMHRLAGKWLR